MNLDELLKRIAELLNRIIDYQMFSILLLDETGEKLQHRFSQRFEERLHLKHDIPLGRGVVGYAAQAKEAVLVPDVSKSERYIATNPETRSELAVPLIYQEKVIGVLDLEHTRRNYFTDDHKRTLTTLARSLQLRLKMRACTKKLLGRNGDWSAIWRWRANCSFACCHILCRRCSISKLKQSLYLLAPLAAISTILFPIRYRVLESRLETSAARALPLLSMLHWSAASCDLMRPIEPGPAEMLSAVNLSLAERRIAAQVCVDHLRGVGR